MVRARAQTQIFWLYISSSFHQHASEQQPPPPHICLWLPLPLEQGPGLKLGGMRQGLNFECGRTGGAAGSWDLLGTAYWFVVSCLPMNTCKLELAMGLDARSRWLVLTPKAKALPWKYHTYINTLKRCLTVAFTTAELLWFSGPKQICSYSNPLIFKIRTPVLTCLRSKWGSKSWGSGSWLVRDRIHE